MHRPKEAGVGRERGTVCPACYRLLSACAQGLSSCSCVMRRSRDHASMVGYVNCLRA